MMVEVTQEDRTAAVDLMLPLCRGDYETAAVCKALLGECDETGPVQAFARHRLAAEQRGKLEGARLALDEMKRVVSSTYAERIAALDPAKIVGEG